MNRNWTGKLQVTLLFLKKRFPQRCFSVNFTKFLRTSFDRTSRDNCFLSLFLNFSEHLFYKAPLRNCLFHVQVAVFQAADAVKNSFTGAIQAFYTRTRSSHSKAFINLKSLKIICEEVNSWWSCEMPTCKLTKKTLLHILLHIFCLHFLRMDHDYFFRRGFKSVREKFLSENISNK